MKNLTIILLSIAAFMFSCSDSDPIEEQEYTPTCTDGIKNGNETGVDCGGDCPESTNAINYPENGRTGANLLFANDATTHPEFTGVFDTEFSLAAILPDGCAELEVQIRNVGDNDCYGLGCWLYTFADVNNWDITEYDFSTNSQTFTNTGQNADMKIFNFQPGQYLIEVFENGAEVANGSTMLTIEGELPTRVHSDTDAADLLVIGNEMFFGSWENRNISKINLTEENPTIQVVAEGLNDPYTLIYHDGNIYFTELSNTDATGGQISRMNPNTGQVTVMLDGLNTPAGLAIDGNTLYFTLANNGEVAKIDLTQTSPEIVTVATDMVTPTGMEIYNGKLYVIETDGYKISSIDLATETPTVSTFMIFSQDWKNLHERFHIEGSNLFFAGFGKIAKVNLDEANPVEEEIIQLHSWIFPSGLAVYNNQLYLAEYPFNIISKIDL